MFTGIIEETGIIDNITTGAKSCRLRIKGNIIFDDLKLGDSVAVNGVCLTVAQLTPESFEADVMAETMRRTGMGALKKGSRVNLDRAMPMNGRFGGHFVSGHIDGVGTVVSKVTEDNAVLVTITADADVMKYIVFKGSVALDGISLTVANVSNDRFTVSIIPHTASETTLLERNIGEKINIECDVIGKYVEKLMGKPQGGITLDFLKENGF